MRKLFIFAAILCFATGALAQEVKPLRALMFVGGCCHDYKTMPGYLTQKVGELANITFDIRPMASAQEMAAAFADPKFAQGYDLVVYDICFGEAWKNGDYDGALRAAASGIPVVFIHCSMHTYRPPRNTKDPQLKVREAIADAKWHALVGMDSRVHDKYESFSTEKADKTHPILAGFPDPWTTPGDELYNTVKMMPTATPLLTAKSPSSGKVHTVAWVNIYQSTRVFGTTLGHDMKTGSDPAYHRLLVSGILWACGKLRPDGTPETGYGQPAPVR